MRQSRRTNTGNRRNSLARRWRPWLAQDASDPFAARPTAAGLPLPAEGGPTYRLMTRQIRMTDDDRRR